MIEWSEARALAHDAGRARAGALEWVSLAGAAGRTLAVTLVSTAALPTRPVSAMDGWVVAGDGPWRVGAPILAGDTPNATALAPRTARPIATGGTVPDGALGVLRTEHGELAGDTLRQHAGTARADEPRQGEHIRAAGEEMVPGEHYLMAGEVLTPPRVALAAAAGVDRVAVAVSPIADVLVLGNELVSEGTPGAGQLRDVFAPQLPGLLVRLGLTAGTLSLSPDDLDSTIALIRASEAPLLITTGGTARGLADHLRAALAAVGAPLLIDGVRMRPGHPLMLAHRDGRLVLSLPGNPLAAMLGLTTIGAALIDGLLGRPLAPLGWSPLATTIANPGADTRLVTYLAGAAGATPTAHQGSAMLRGLSQAHGVAAIPSGGARAGQIVRTVPLPW